MKAKTLKVGDEILLKAKVTELTKTEDQAQVVKVDILNSFFAKPLSASKQGLLQKGIFHSLPTFWVNRAAIIDLPIKEAES